MRDRLLQHLHFQSFTLLHLYWYAECKLARIPSAAKRARTSSGCAFRLTEDSTPRPRRGRGPDPGEGTSTVLPPGPRVARLHAPNAARRLLDPTRESAL